MTGRARPCTSDGAAFTHTTVRDRRGVARIGAAIASTYLTTGRQVDLLDRRQKDSRSPGETRGDGHPAPQGENVESRRAPVGGPCDSLIYPCRPLPVCPYPMLPIPSRRLLPGSIRAPLPGSIHACPCCAEHSPLPRPGKKLSVC